MRVLQPKEGQTYLYFYEDSDFNPSQNISKVRSLLKRIGCKIGSVWRREPVDFYLGSCEIGDFKLVNDVPAIYIESEDSEVIKYLAAKLEIVCHKYEVGADVRFQNGQSGIIKEYIKEDYIIVVNGFEKQVSEDDIVCRKVIPDNIVGKEVIVSLIDPDFGEYEQCKGCVVRTEICMSTLCIVVEVVTDWEEEDEIPFKYENKIYENEIKELRVIS